MNRTNPKVNAFFERADRWHEELAALRKIILQCGLSEELKWGQPCYTSESRNIVIIHGFKEYCAILFFKGALLKDPKRVLIQQTENVQSARQIRFTSVGQINKLRPVLKAYIEQAIEVEKAGMKVNLKKEFTLPEEFERKLVENPALKTAFHALTPGRQRAYALYFSAAKQSKTRESRIAKHVQRIFDGKGLND